MGKLLPNRELSKQEYFSICRGYVGEGSEAIIFRNGGSVSKIFKENFGYEVLCEEEREEIRENKLHKLEILYCMKEFDNLFLPIETYSYHHKFVGYKGVYLSCPTLDMTCLDKEEKIFYLKLFKEKLLRYHELGIVYGDIKDDNVMIDTKNRDIVLIDIDNMMVLDHPINVMSCFVEDFIKNYGRVDEKLDSYMLNLLTITQLLGNDYWYFEVKEQLEKGFVPLELQNQKNQKLIRQMGYVDKNYSGHYFVDGL